jgi:23S rRNA G2445 N2-methylase RlmL
MTRQTTYEFFATCAKGAEKVLARELSLLAGGGAPARASGETPASAPAATTEGTAVTATAQAKRLRIRPLNSGVAFFGTIQDAYRALLHLFCASRVLLILGRGSAGNADELYTFVRSLPWEEHISPTGTIAVDARGTNKNLRDTRFIAQKVKDAVCDHLLELYGKRPSVEKNRPDVRLNVSLHDARVTVALDLAGEPLHRRGYRVSSSAIIAPLRETLAATMLMLDGWGCREQDSGTDATDRWGTGAKCPTLVMRVCSMNSSAKVGHFAPVPTVPHCPKKHPSPSWHRVLYC